MEDGFTWMVLASSLEVLFIGVVLLAAISLAPFLTLFAHY